MAKIFEKESSECKDEYKTFENSPLFGKEVPTLAYKYDENGSIVEDKDGVRELDQKLGNIWDLLAKEPLTNDENKSFAMPKWGEQVVVVVFWGKYYTNTHPFMPAYSKLQAKYGDKVSFLAVSLDGVKDWSTGWFKKDKYYGKYPTKMAAVWDKDYIVKKVFTQFGCDAKGNPMDKNFNFCTGTLPVPTAFVFGKDKKLKWFQNHSAVYNDAPTMMWLMEEQLDLIVEDKPVKSVYGDKEPEEDSDDEEEEESDDEASGPVDLGF